MYSCNVFYDLSEKSNTNITVRFYWFHGLILFSKEGELYEDINTRKERSLGLSWRPATIDIKFSI